MATSVYERWGIKTAINAWTWMTPLGGSVMAPEVLQAMMDAAPYYLDIGELSRKAGEIIAEHTGAEDGMVTAGCAAALGLQMAACMTGTDLAKVRQLPDTTDVKDEVIIPRNQRMPFDQAFKIPGGRLVEVGRSERLSIEDYESAITEKTAAIAYIFGPGMGRIVSLKDVVAVARRHDVPVIVDAAAMLPPKENLTRYIAEGADLVAFSGGKGLGGPQSSGILCGRKDLVEAARLHTCPHAVGILRVAKVCKEEIVGLVTALELFVKRDHEAVWNGWRNKAQVVVDALQDIPGIEVTLEEDKEEFERQGPQAVVTFGTSWKGPSAEDVRKLLLGGDPPIYIYGTHGIDQNEVWVGTVDLQEGEEEIVARRLGTLLSQA